MLVLIPMPVLFGVFLFMGMSSLDGLQFWDRINLFFMPAKHQPDMPYLRRVPLKRIHLFTILQLLCFTILWVVKVLSLTRILFPVMVSQ